MAIVLQRIKEAFGRVAQLKLGQGKNQQARASDVNQIIDFLTISVGNIPLVAEESVTGDGVASVSTFHTAWTTSGSDDITLADGEFSGQLKEITMVADGGDGVLTPDNLSGGTTITFGDVGDTVLLGWNGSTWIILKNIGCTVA